MSVDITTLAGLPKIDSHHHVWDLSNPYPWLTGPIGWRTYGDYSPMCRNYLIEDFRRDAETQNVIASVHVQANWDHSDPVGETRWVQQCADTGSMLDGIVAHANLCASNIESVLDEHMAFANMRGVRHIIGHTSDPDGTEHPDEFDRPEFERGYAALGARGLSFDLQAYPHQLERVRPLVGRHEDVPLMICHTGFPWDRSEQGRQRWRSVMAEFAAMEHCSVKLSGPCMVMRDWTPETFGWFIHTTIELFGPDRCTFASNVPPDSLSKPYEDIYADFYSLATRYSLEENRAMFFDTANRFYRLAIAKT